MPDRAPGRRIHIFGSSGSGTTTLGRAVAQHLSIPHFDTDDVYWLPTARRFEAKRPVPDRLRLMEELFLPAPDWVLSGSLESWGGPITHRFTLAVRLTLDPEVREARLRSREAARGTLDEEFIDWVRGYEGGQGPGRSLPRHLAFAESLACPVLTLDTAAPVDHLASEVIAALEAP